MYRALIVDDHESLCDSLARALAATGEFEVAGKLSSAAAASAYCERLRPDLVLMDVCTEGGVSGLDAAREIRERFPEIKVVVMSGFDEITYAPRAREAGAHAFVLKSRSLDFFLEAARGVMRGETYYPEARTIPLPQGEAPLTRREQEVLRLVCKNLTNEEIAEELFISVSTVKYHKANMLAKMGFTKTIDLAFYMISNGWINPMY
jgi:DNA-binding NarL/FixJ family response regulator